MTEENILYIKKGFERTSRTKDILNETNDLTIGQTFHAVADFNGKIKEDYPRWISFEKNKSEFDIIKARVDECENDLDKVNLVSEWLGEELFG